MLKVLSWNIRQGGGSRLAKICQKIKSSEAQIIILSEFINNDSGAFIRQKLLSYEYRYQGVTASPKDENSVAIFSKISCNFILFPYADPKYSGNLIAAQFDAFDIYGMYLPHKKKHILFDTLIHKSKESKPAIFAGDFNSGINYKDQKGNSFWYTDKLEALSKNNYIDAFRFKNGDIEEYSWFSHQKNGYRYDHTYVDAALKIIIKECHYIHQWRIDGLSDHSPMILHLGQ